MHFFTDFDLLNSQTSSDAFGAVNNSSSNYRVLNIFTSSTNSNAYAICDGYGFIQENLDNNSTVNFIFKPDKQLFDNFPEISYFIYRGILKNSFLAGNGEILSDNPTLNNDLLNRMWEVKNIRNLEKQEQDPNYQPNGLMRSDLGLNEIGEPSLDGTYPIDQTFFFNNFQKIREGNTIGKFDSDGFAIEIVLNTDYKLKYDDVRYSDHVINVNSSFPNLESLSIKLEREKILNYLDITTVFGGAFNKIKTTLKNSDGSITTVSGEQYSQILSKFANKNIIYLDIRNEYNFSLNFFDNYSTSNNIAYINIPASIPYHDGNGWPIVKLDGLTSDSNNGKQKIEISFPIGDNLNPICFLNKSILFDEFPNGIEKFIIPNNPVEIGSPKFGNNELLPYYNNLNLCRRYNINTLPQIPSNLTRYYKDNFLDNIFIINSYEFENQIGWVIYNSSSVSYYNGWSSLDGFDFLYKNGIARDNIGITFYAFVINPIEINGVKSSTSTFYDLNLTSGKKRNKSFYHVLQDQLEYLNLTEYPIATGSNNFKSYLVHSNTDNISNNVQSYSADNLMCCSITEGELNSLSTVINSFNDDGALYIVLLDYNLNEDNSGFPYFEFTVGLQGIRDSGQISIENTGVKVFSTDGRIFMSEDYAELLDI